MSPLNIPSRLHLKTWISLPTLLILTALHSPGAVLNWDAATSTNWNTTDLNWGAIPWNNPTPDEAVFGPTGVGTVTLTTGITAQSLTFNTTGYTIAGNTLTMGGTAPSFTTAADVTAIITSNVAGTAGVVKNGSGTLAFGAGMTYTGGTIVNGGILDLTGGGGSTGTIRGTATINPGATLRLSVNDATGYGTPALTTINLNGGALNVNTVSNQTLGSATVNLTGGSITGIATSNLDFFGGASALNTLASADTSTISGVKINLRQNNGVTFNVADGAAAVDLNVTSVISSSAGFTDNNFIKAGAGSMVISGASTYTTATNVTGGLLTVNGTLRSTSAANVGIGSTLELNATNIFTGGHGTAMGNSRVITVNGGTLLMSAGFTARFGNVTLNNGATWTNNNPASGYGALLANTDTGAATISVTGTAASIINGSGGINIQGIQNFNIADVTGNADADLTITSVLGGTGTQGGDAGGINKTGAGTLVLSNLANAYAGNLTVAAGRINTGTTQGGGVTGYLGAVNGTRVITVESGGTLQFLANNQFGGSGKTAATIPSLVIRGTLDSTRFNIIGTTAMEGGTLSQTATDSGSYQGYQFLGDVTVGGTSASTISTGNSKANHLLGGGTTNFIVNDATSTAASDLLVSAPLTNGSGDYTGTGSLGKSGPGTMELAATNTYTGSTSVTGGNLLVSGSINTTSSLFVQNASLTLGGADRLNDAAAVSLNNGTIRSGGFSESTGVLTLAGDNFLDLGAGASIFRFADSSAAIWSSTLTISGWTSGTDSVFFGTSLTGLTPDQLTKVSFLNPGGVGTGTYAASILPSGEIVPVPEPGLLGLLSLGLTAILRRRR